MNYKNNNAAGARVYEAPSVETVELLAENFTMTSGLQDYEDNPIFG